MKQTFTLELDLPSDTSRVSELRLGEAIRRGYKEYFGQVLPNLFVSEIDVEQNCGTPENVNQKAFDLLKRAVKVIDDYKIGDKINSLDDMAWEIDNYLEETKGKDYRIEQSLND